MILWNPFKDPLECARVPKPADSPMGGALRCQEVEQRVMHSVNLVS